MAGRPAPEIIITTEHEHYRIDVMPLPVCYQLTYEGSPVALRYERYALSGNSKQYRRTTWPHVATAKNAAERLNQQFNTDKFGYQQL